MKETGDSSRLTPSQRRLWGRTVSGMGRKGRYRFMTLTSSLESPADIHHSFRVLKERLRYRGKFEYIAVREVTVSGLIHLHLVWRGGFVDQRWLSDAWREIHNAPVVWVERVKGRKGVAGYLAKELSKAPSGRFWSSWGWIYRGWKGVQRGLGLCMEKLGKGRSWKDRVQAWERHCQGGLVAVGWLVVPSADTLAGGGWGKAMALWLEDTARMGGLQMEMSMLPEGSWEGLLRHVRGGWKGLDIRKEEGGG